MDYSSEEMKNLKESPSSITHVSIPFIDMKSIKDDLRIFLLTKDKNLLNVYDKALLSRSFSDSGNDTIKDLLNIFKEFYLIKYKDDKIKNLTCRKLFDTITLSLECLMINEIDISSDEINTLILGFLNKNFL
jgi:hypothetical protein